MAKKMGTGRADASLVAAGYRLGQSYVPGDYSKIFQKQYEGLLASHTARTQAGIDFYKTLDKNVDEIYEAKKGKSDWLEESTSWFKQLEDANTNYASGKISENADHYENNGNLNIAFDEGDEDYFIGLKDQYEKLNKKLILTKKERIEKKQIERNITEFRDKYNKSKANWNSSGVNWGQGFYNKEQSFRGEPELQMLWTQLMDPNANLNEKEIKVFWKNGERYFEYTDGRTGAEIKALAKGEGDTQIPFANKGSKKKNIISEKELLSRLKPIDSKSVNDANGVGNAVLDNQNKLVTNADGVKVFKIKNFNQIEDKILTDYENVFKQSANFNDLATREVLIGNNRRIYKKDLEENRIIDAAIINQLGFGGTFTEKELTSGGGIDPKELAAHANAKKQIIEILTNPKTDSQRDIAVKEMARYRTDQLRDVFEGERTRLQRAESKTTTETYMQNSLNIRNKFEEAEKEGFTFENLKLLPIDDDKQIILNPNDNLKIVEKL